MGKFVYTNARIFAGGADLTTRSNKIELGGDFEEKDVTCFVESGELWKEVMAGLANADIKAEGLWEAGDPGKVDDSTFAGLGVIGAWSVGPAGAAVGDLAWLTSAHRGNYALGGAVGDTAPWSASASGSAPLVRGRYLHAPGVPRTATGTGTAVLHVPVAAGKYLYANLHVLSVAGTGTPTITARIETDDAIGFPSPSTVATFAAATARGAQQVRATGPITDSYYRAAWTITGTSPSFLFVVSVGVA